MEPLNHQMMGYDRAVSMFSPDGRLLQVEYAKKTVKQGSVTVGMVCSDGVVLVALKRLPSKLVIPESVEKIYQIDNHMAATFSGITSDARVLVERSQIKAQQHKIQYDTPADVISVVKDVSDLKQYTTQSGALRPFGTALIIGGVDVDGPKIFVTDPTGIYFQYKAVAIGGDSEKVEEVLNSEYKESLNCKECIEIAIKAIKKSTEDVLTKDNIDAIYIKTEKPLFTLVDKKDIENFLK